MHRSMERGRRTDMMICILLALVTAAVSCFFSLYGCDPHHDGVMFEAALKVARGGLLFRDTFTQYGALAVWYDALFIRLFGETMASIQLAACVGLGACAAVVYTITKKVTERPLAALTAFMVLGLNYIYFWHSHPWSSVPAMFFQLLACELAMQEHLDGKGWKLVLAGACGACGAWCRLPVGLLTFMAGIVGLVLVQVIRRDKAAVFAKKLALYVGGFAAALGLLLLPILLTGTFDAWYGMVIVGTSNFAAETNTAGASTGFVVRLGWSLVGAWILRNPLFDWLWLALPACMGLTLLVIGWPVVMAYGKNLRAPQIPYRSEEQRLMVLVCAFACGGWAQYYPVACYRHWYWSAMPMLPILAYDIRQLLRRPRRARPWLPAAAMAVLLAGNLLLRGYFGLATLGVIHYEKDPDEKRPGITGFYMDENWNRNDTVLYKNDAYPYLNGLKLAPDTAAFYDELYAVLGELKAKYPEKNVYNRTAEGFLGVFQGEYIPYGTAAYRDYGLVENEYIAANKPVVITQSETDWQGCTDEYRTYAVIKGNDGRINNAAIYIMVAE